MVQTTLEKLGKGINLSESETHQIMNAIMDGTWTSAQIAGLLMGLKIKGETVEEITGFVKAMRSRAAQINAPLNTIDTCGTGGDGRGTFNISTTSAIVAAAAGVPVAKHGNRSVSSRCGSADVLQELGVKVDITPEQAGKCLNDVGIVFLFAPVYHASMKHAAVPRREMGIRTIFNILGPMTNPAAAKRQLIGVFDLATAEKMIQVLQKTGSHHVMAVHSEDGLDEISLHAKTHVYELKDGDIAYYKLNAADSASVTKSKDGIDGGDAATNAQIINTILEGQAGAQLEITVLNAGAAIYIGGQAPTYEQGVAKARETILSGLALAKLNDLKQYTNRFGN